MEKVPVSLSMLSLILMIIDSMVPILSSQLVDHTIKVARSMNRTHNIFFHTRTEIYVSRRSTRCHSRYLDLSYESGYNILCSVYLYTMIAEDIEFVVTYASKEHSRVTDPT